MRVFLLNALMPDQVVLVLGYIRSFAARFDLMDFVEMFPSWFAKIWQNVLLFDGGLK